MSPEANDINATAEDLRPGMCLIGIARVDESIDSGEMPKPIRVKVTEGTKRVLIVVRGLALAFGETTDPQTRPLGDLRWQTEIVSLAGTTLQFNVVAQLICTETTDKYYGNISIDVFCFGQPNNSGGTLH
ncbi:MAG: hypothetical protein HY913_10155 [Desulfomonile tiedjei]|nr:hypothetical protein [Desulfomonile tiedjei]